MALDLPPPLILPRPAIIRASPPVPFVLGALPGLVPIIVNGKPVARPAPTFIGNAGMRYVDSGNNPIPYHDDTAPGDFLLLLAVTTQNPQLTTPSGWIKRFSVSDTFAAYVHCYCRFAAFERSVVFSNGFKSQMSTVLSFRGVDPGNPIEGSDVLGSAQSKNFSIAGVTTSIANCLVVAGVASGQIGDLPIATNWANANLSGGQELVDIQEGHIWLAHAAYGGVLGTAGPAGSTTGTLDFSAAHAKYCIALAGVAA